MARSVNIGFNFQTTNASKSLKDLLNNLKSLNKEASKSTELKFKVNTTELKNTQKAMGGLVPTKAIQSLEEMLILSGRLKDNLGKNSKLDYATIKIYEENLDKVTKTAERLMSIFKDSDIMKALDSKGLAELNVDLKELKRTFGSTKNDIIGFTEEHIKSTKAVETLARKIENQKRALSELSQGNIKSKLSVESLSNSYDDLSSRLYTALKNVDYTQLDSLQREFKALETQHKSLVKQIGQPVNYGINLTPMVGKSQNLELPKFIVDAKKFNADLMAFKYSVTGDLNELTEKSKKFMGSFLTDKNLKSNLESIISSINRLESEMSQVGTNTRGIEEYRNELKKLQSDYNKMSKSTGESIGGTLTQFAGYYAMLNVGRTAFRGFMELEDATYNLGVVAQKSKYEMEDLRKTVIGMSIGTANTATEMANAMNTVMRAGMDYATAQAVVSETSKLAVASGEDLASSIDIVNKIFIALKINAEDAHEAVQDLHATATFTATDMEGLGSSARQYIGALGVLASTTSKNDEELGKYRVSLMKTGNALTGILANMGKDFAQPIKLISKRCA